MSDKLRGHDIYFDGKSYRYTDNNDETVLTWHGRDCGHCRLPNRPDGHDACLGELVGVMNACCGHGVDEQAYVQFADGSTVHSNDALRIFETKKEAN
jgi:hypothetical protein